MWLYHGQKRPAFAIRPGLGQESVWDYPRPPVIVPDSRLVEIRAGGLLIASTTRAHRILETASPPTFYLPRGDVDLEQLVPSAGRSICEWKGEAAYWAIRSQATMPVGWTYEHPCERFQAIAGALSFYPGRVECRVAGERVLPQPGGFYGGWVTDDVVGPFKGEVGTGHW